MAIFETHAHYFDEQFDLDRENILHNLENLGIEYIIEIGDSIENSKKVLNLVSRNQSMYAAVGIHPENVKDVNQNDFLELEKMLKEKETNKIVAVGEIGLDYHYGENDEKLQKEIFVKQLELARKYNLPVIIHSRDASSDTFEIMKEHVNLGTRGIMHCFAGSLEMARQYTKMGILLGIGGVVTFKNAKKLVEVVKEIGLENMVIETDSPYLSPEPNRGKRNDSSNLKYVISKIADIKGVDYSKVEMITCENAKKVFGL